MQLLAERSRAEVDAQEVESWCDACVRTLLLAVTTARGMGHDDENLSKHPGDRDPGERDPERPGDRGDDRVHPGDDGVDPVYDDRELDDELDDRLLERQSREFLSVFPP